MISVTLANSARIPGAAQHHSASQTRVNALVVMRCRPGIARNSVSVAVPDQRCTASLTLALALHRVRDTWPVNLESNA
jgi:hypothetical protein